MSYLDPKRCVSPYCNEFVEYDEGSNLCGSCRTIVVEAFRYMSKVSNLLDQLQVTWFVCEKCLEARQGACETWQGHRLCKPCSEQKYLVRYECSACKKFCQSDEKKTLTLCDPCFKQL